MSKNGGLSLHTVGHAYNDVYFFIIPLLLPLLRQEFGLSYAQSGLLLTVHVALRSIFSLICGHLGDIGDKGPVLAAGFLLSSFFLGGLVWTETITGVVALLLLLAVGVAAFHPLATAMVGENAPAERRAFRIGIFEAAGGVGVILASFGFGFLVEALGWRTACLIIALPGLFLGVAYLRFRDGKLDPEGGDPIARENVAPRYILFFLAARGVFFLGSWAYLSFLPTYASDQLGLPAGPAAWFISLTFLGAILGNLAFGWYTDRKEPLLVVCLSITLATSLLSGITFTTSMYLVGLLTVGYGVAQGGIFTSQNTWLTEVSTISTRGKALGASFLFEGISATAAPTLYGWIADRIGLVGAFRWASVPLALSLLLYLVLFHLNLDGRLADDSSKAEA